MFGLDSWYDSSSTCIWVGITREEFTSNTSTVYSLVSLGAEWNSISVMSPLEFPIFGISEMVAEGEVVCGH